MSSEPTYDLKSGKKHPFHLVEPSAWPLVGSIAAFVLACGALFYMHPDFAMAFPGGFGFVVPDLGLTGLVIGFLFLLWLMWVWWRDVIDEAVAQDVHTPEVRVGFRWGMLLFIASEVMFFFAFFWAFFNASLMPTEAIGGVWPPASVEVVETFGLPFLMTLILLLSGCTVTWAHHAILENKQQEAVKALAITVALGFLFTCIQGYEYAISTFGFKDGIYSSAFYMATGFHGFHVIVGSIFLLVCLFRAKKGHFTAESHFGFEAAAWYWHFVDVVWLFLFVAVYWWGNAGGVVALH